MKKSAHLIALAILLSIFLPSCCKREMPPINAPVTTNINATLQENQTYQFTLPAAVNGQIFTVTKQPDHSTISYISTDGSGNNVYQYMPALNYTGTDNVSFSNNALPTCGNCNSGCHGSSSCFQHTCGHHQSCIRQNLINITFIITPKNTAATVSNKEVSGIK